MAILQSVVELSSGLPKTNPASGREEDLNPGPPDYKSSALTNRPSRLPLKCNPVMHKHSIKWVEYSGVEVIIDGYLPHCFAAR